MTIFIPTYKRLNRQPTLEALTAAGVPCTLVVRPEEAAQAQDLVHAPRFKGLAGVWVLPSTVSNIGQTRQWIVDNSALDRIVMMDDDLVFACRGKREDNPLYLSPCTPDDIQSLVDWMYTTLMDEAMVGISSREGNNRKPESIERCTRMMRAWGFRKDVFRQVGASFENMECMEDFDVILTFLTNSHANLVNNEFTTNQAGSNTDGGCSTYRTLEIQAKAAYTLAAKYPGIVKAVEKETKGSWGGGKRTDVHIMWKKAYEQGMKK